MDINITLRNGPLDIEIETDSEEDYEQEILNISSFLEENEENLAVLDGTAQPCNESSNEGDNGSQQTPLEEFSRGERSTPDGASETDSRFGSVHRRTGVDTATLARLFDVPDPDEDDVVIPAIFVDEFEEGNEMFGSSRTERQARASLILLYLWEECLGNTEINSSDLSDALHMSGIDPTNKSNMYNALGGDADRYFSREEGSPHVSLSRHGKRAAVDEIQRVVEELNNE